MRSNAARSAASAASSSVRVSGCSPPAADALGGRLATPQRDRLAATFGAPPAARAAAVHRTNEREHARMADAEIVVIATPG